MSDQITLRVRNRRELQRRLTEIELKHEEVWTAEKWEVYQAIVELALDNPELLVEKLAEVQHH
ncbi:hypothetical protein [Natrialba swarupiae]|uniref:Uncharacterized protein n=1 Tax=Natrialba swarupiae TaxID=2448032 RepID=A0A5D5AMC7_9EURY|nr:hypothetical protein [Natrialba swarupiae]MCW8172727.1 hypothetical protein [Natrialba swarupiae]TYT60862.1 hypothetical protein FYC77_16680 [Natrialba swarupiae]